MTGTRPLRAAAAVLPLVVTLLLTGWLAVPAPSVGAEGGAADVSAADEKALARCARPAPLPALRVRDGAEGAAGAVAATGLRRGVPARAQALAVTAVVAGDLRPSGATRFYRRLTRLPRWESLPPTIAVHRVLGTPDPFGYEVAWSRATASLSELTGRPPAEVTRAVAPGGDAPRSCTTSPLSRRGLPLPPGSSYAVAGSDTEGEVLLTAPCGTPVLAAARGQVAVTRDDPEGGPWVLTVSGGGAVTRYAHVQRPVVGDGATVALGQQLAEVGDFGAVERCALGLSSRATGGERRDAASVVQWLVSGNTRDVELRELAEAVEGQVRPVVPERRRGSRREDPPARAPTPTAPTAFRVASFNVLGAHLTAPGGSKRGFGPGPQRMTRGLATLEASGASVAVLNEFENPAASVVLADGDWELHRATPNNRFRDGNTSGNAIAWRRDTWTLLGTEEFTVPWKVTLHMPVATLEHRDTGARVTVIGVHNPATTARQGNQSAARAVARRVELAQVAALRRADPSTPVLLAGDFNERDEVYCGFLGSGLLQSSAPRGRGGTGCRAPGHTVDWIFGTTDLSFGGEVVDRSTLGTISDHPLLTAAVVLPPQLR